MRQLSEVHKSQVSRAMRKGYLRLLTAQAKRAAIKIDGVFFMSEEEKEAEGVDDSSIRPYFYGSLLFGATVSIFAQILVYA